MIYQDYNVRAVGLVDGNGIILQEAKYKEYAENVKLLADTDSEYFTVINRPSGRPDGKEDIIITFSDEYHIVINYNGLCLTDAKSVEISSDEDTPAVIYTGEDEFFESHGISCPDAFKASDYGDYCFKLEFDFEEVIGELDERPSVFFKLILFKTPDKIMDMKYPCMITEINSGTDFINGQGIELKALLSPLMIEPVTLAAFGISDKSSIDYAKISSLCRIYEPLLKYLQYTNNILVYDREKNILNIKHIFISDNMHTLAITNEFINKISRILSPDSGIFQYHELINSDTLLTKVLNSDDMENVVMVGNSPIIGRNVFYNMDEDSITEDIKTEVDKIYDELDKESKEIDMNSLEGFKFSELVNARYDGKNIFSNLLELLNSDEGVLVYEPNDTSKNFHLVFIRR